MRCGQIAEVLNRVQVGVGSDGAALLTSADAPALDAMARGGFVTIKPAAPEVDEVALARKRSELSDLQARFDTPGAVPPEVKKLEATLRTEILELAEQVLRSHGGAPFGDRRVALTFRGRELLSALSVRIARVETSEIGVFDSEMNALRESLAARGKKAAEILKAISPAIEDIDEIHLRSAAVGLAARPESSKEIARGYIEVVRTVRASVLPTISRPLLAELIVAARGPRGTAETADDIAEIEQLRNDIAGSIQDQQPLDVVTAACLLFPLDPGGRRSAIDTAAAIMNAQRDGGSYKIWTLAPWVLVGATKLSGQTGALDWVERMRVSLLDKGHAPADAEMAAAIMGTSRVEAGLDLIYQFERAYSYLSRFSGEGMAVPAAMLAALPPGIEESLDDLRMASSEVSANKLSVGGVENLSLAVKMLMQTAVLAADPSLRAPWLQVRPEQASALFTLGLPGIAVAVPTAIAAYYAFHEVSLHQVAVNQYRFHPVHMHYIYG